MPTLTHVTLGGVAADPSAGFDIPSFSVTAGELIVVSVGACSDGNGFHYNPLWQVSGGGLAWGHLNPATQPSGSFKANCAIAWAIAGTTGTLSPHVTTSPHSDLSYFYSVEKVTSFNALSPVGAVAVLYDDSNDGQKDITLDRAPAATSLLYAQAFLNVDDSNTTKAVDPGASDGWTEAWENGTFGSGMWGVGEGQRLTGWTSTRVRWDDIKPASFTGSAYSFCGTAIEILASAGSTASVYPASDPTMSRSTGATASVAKPVGARTGDVYVVAYQVSGFASTPTGISLSGFSQSAFSGVANTHGCWFWRTYDGSEASTFDVTGNASHANNMSCWLIRGAPAGWTPSTPGMVVDATTTSVVLPAQTQTVGALMLVQYLDPNSGQGTVGVIPSSIPASFLMDGNYLAQTTFHQAAPSTGSWGPFTLVKSSGTASGAVQQMFIAPPSGGGSSPQTVTAQVATLIFTPVAGTKTGGPVSRAAQVATLTLAGVAGTNTAGPVSKAGQVAALALTPVPGTKTVGPVTLAAQVAALALTPVVGTLTGGPVTRAAQVAALILTAVPGAPFTGTAVVPTKVTGLTVTATTPTTVSLSWTAPADGGSPITDYVIEYAIESSYIVFAHAPSTATTITVTGLDPLTSYWLHVAAVNSVGTGPFSDSENGITTSTAQTIVGQVATLTLTAVSGVWVIGPLFVTFLRASLTLTAIPGVLTQTGAGVTVNSQVATLTLTGLSGTRTGGPSTWPAQVANLALTAVPGTVAPGPVSKAGQVAVLALTGVPGTRSILTTIAAQIASLTLTGLAGTRVGGPVTQPGQVALLTLTAVHSRLTLPHAVSANDFATTLTDQRVEIRVNKVSGSWGLFVRGPALMTIDVEQPGYYVVNTAAGIDWYRAGALVASVVMPEFSTAAGTVELECRGEVCTLRVLGQSVATHDFGDAPLTADDDHQGFASYGGAGLVIVDAEGGGIPEPVEVDDGRDHLFEDTGPSPSRPLVAAGESERRPLITTGPGQAHRPL